MPSQICLNDWDNFGPETVTDSRFEMKHTTRWVGVLTVGTTVLNLDSSPSAWMFKIIKRSRPCYYGFLVRQASPLCIFVEQHYY
jgi:hypothetical protein